MRSLADEARIRAFLRALGEAARNPARIYLTGGATAVLHEWRASTMDLDIKLVPDSSEVLRAIPALKKSLQINVELASPDQFIPVAAGWEERSVFRFPAVDPPSFATAVSDAIAKAGRPSQP